MGSNIKSRSASKVALESFDDLFGGNTAQESGVEQIINAPLAELYTFKDHPFRVEDDEKMEETTESIRKYGVLAILPTTLPEGVSVYGTFALLMILDFCLAF